MIAALFLTIFAGGSAGPAGFAPSAARTRGSGFDDAGFRVKPIAAVIDYPIAWSLQTGETITESTWAVHPVEAGGMAVVSGTAKIVGAVTACLVSGGINRRVYALTNTITTSDERIYSETMVFRIGPAEPA